MPSVLTTLLSLCLACTFSTAQADSETILHAFTGSIDDGADATGLVADEQGNVFGTTFQGGVGSCLPVGGCGTVFQAVPVRDGSGTTRWNGKIIYKFKGGNSNGGGPNGPVVAGPSGNLYGTTLYGGGTGCGGIGCGTVFELHTEGGLWVETVLYKFTGGADGGNPESSVTLDRSGNIFGTTYNGGLEDCNGNRPCGVVFALQRTGSGWTERVLHSFDYTDGANPLGGIVIDPSGNLYGTTPDGGSSHPPPGVGAGTIFELRSTESGWDFGVLYNFAEGDGAPAAGLTLDAKGNLYGTANGGGSFQYGSVFELQRPTQDGESWSFSNIYSFTLGRDGGFPGDSVVFDRAGNLYGTASAGGTIGPCQVGCGVVFELTPSQGLWTDNVLYSLPGGADGQLPVSAVLLDPVGNIYGTTASGGDASCVVYGTDSGCGIVYRINRDAP